MAYWPLPWPFPPMLLTQESGAPRDEPGFIYEVKWDGLRTIIRVDGGRADLASRTGRPRTALFPELQALTGQVVGTRPVILDAELVVVTGQKVSFGKALARDRSRDPRTVAQAAADMPATLMVFDLLAEGETAWLERPLYQRRERLAEVIRPGGPGQVVEGFSAGADLYRAVGEAGMEGVVGKRLDTLYRPGVRCPHWHKYKHRRVLDAVVVGLSPAESIPTAVHLAVHDEAGRLVYIGKAGSGLTRHDASQLAESLPPAPVAPCSGAPRHDVRWVLPVLTARVGYLEWTDNLHLRQPSILGWSTLDPQACRFP
jgi:bifunctional non-homologous end joining protein LigD